ncbi:MAG: ATP-binding cassette domain-containing protein [Pirellulales bacterium]
MSETLYELRDVVHGYGPDFSLRVPRLDLPAGQVLALVGPVGAGKSTLLRLLAGLETPRAGQVQFVPHRQPAARLSLPARRNITLVFQKPLLLDDTVRANVDYPLRLRGGPSQQRHTRVDQILRELHLDELANRPAHTLSGGQAHLTALARALVLQPQVLLLDEPTAHLDPARVALVEAAVLSHHRDRGITVVWATHNLFQARRVASRVSLMLDGQLVETADAETFFQSPADPRTAAFVAGRMVY